MTKVNFCFARKFAPITGLRSNWISFLILSLISLLVNILVVVFLVVACLLVFTCFFYSWIFARSFQSLEFTWELLKLTICLSMKYGVVCLVFSFALLRHPLQLDYCKKAIWESRLNFLLLMNKFLVHWSSISHRYTLRMY